MKGQPKPVRNTMDGIFANQWKAPSSSPGNNVINRIHFFVVQLIAIENQRLRRFDIPFSEVNGCIAYIKHDSIYKWYDHWSQPTIFHHRLFYFHAKFFDLVVLLNRIGSDRIRSVDCRTFQKKEKQRRFVFIDVIKWWC